MIHKITGDLTSVVNSVGFELNSLSPSNKFKETEGIHVEVINNGNEQKISIAYNLNGDKETIEIDKELLEEIIKERQDFEKAVEEKK